MVTVMRNAGLVFLLLLICSACSTAKVASPLAPTPSTAEQLPPVGPAASVPKIAEPVTPPASIAPASSTHIPFIIPVPGPNEVWIWDNEYRPSELTVPAGTTVVWTSHDDFHQHDVDCPGVFFSSLAYGVSFNYTFVERGVFEYQDRIFGMIGKIIVK